jgi:hypothetical protein
MSLRPLHKSVLPALFCSTLVSVASSAAIVTQDENNKDFNVASGWSNDLVPTPDNDYFTSTAVGGDMTLRSPGGGGTFSGGSLTIVSGTRLITKGGNGATTIVSNLILDGGTIQHADGNRTHILEGGLNIAAPAKIRLAGADRIFELNSLLTGSSDLTLEGPGRVVLGDAVSTFSGTFIGISDILADFDQSYSASSLDLSSGSQIRIDSNLIFQSVTFGGTPLAPNTYLVSDLNSTFGSFIDDSSSGLTLTVVPQPTSLAMLGVGAMALLARRRAD